MKFNVYHRFILTYILLIIFENAIKDFLFFITPSANYLLRDIFSMFCVVITFLMLFRSASFTYNKNEKFLLIFIAINSLFIPIYSGFLAYINYGQDILYGFLAERGRLVSISIIILYYALKQKKITLFQIHEIIIKLSWICLIIYLSYRMLYSITPGIFATSEEDAIKGLSMFDIRTIETKGSITMRVSQAFLVYAIITYFINYINKRKLKDIFKLLAFFLFIVIFIKSRGIIVFVGMTLILAYWQTAKIKGKMISAVLFCILALTFIYSNSILENDSSPSFISSFVNIINGIGEAKKGNISPENMEASTWARFYSLDIVFTSFSQNPANWIFGTGRLSNQYNGGAQKQIGEYFYPEDIGIPGAIFLYGIIILALFKIVYLFIYKNLKLPDNPIYIQAMRFFVLYLFINSIQTGSDIMGSPELLLVFFAFSIHCHILNRLIKGKKVKDFYSTSEKSNIIIH